MQSLYDIDIELQLCLVEAEAQAEENEGEISEAIGKALEGLQQEKSIKIGNICRYLKSLKGEAGMIKTEEQALAKRRKIVENKADSLKKYLSCFIPKGEKFSDANSKVSWRKSESVLIEDLEKVPEEYQKITVAADKTAIKKDIKNGVEVEGAKLIENQNIQIK